MEPYIARKFAGYVAWIPLRACQRCKFCGKKLRPTTIPEISNFSYEITFRRITGALNLQLNLQGKGRKLQGKEYSRKGPTIPIRVNLKGMDLSRKSRSGIRKEQYMQEKEFARNGLCNECGLYVVSITVP